MSFWENKFWKILKNIEDFVIKKKISFFQKRKKYEFFLITRKKNSFNLMNSLIKK